MAFSISSKLSKSPQYVIDRSIKTDWRGIELTVASENIEKETLWKIHEERHALIVHLGGKINKIETEIDRRVSKAGPPTDGEFWLVPSRSEYFTFTQGESVSYAEFYFDLNYLEGLLGEKAKNYELLPRIGQYDKFLHQNVKELVSQVSATDDISMLIGENLSAAICLYLFRNYSARENAYPIKTGFTPTKFSLIQEYIHDNLSERIRLEDLAGIADTSTHGLFRLFNASFGRTPAQYIIDQRLRKSRWLLVNTKKDITTIALETGFSSHSHLTSTFKKKLKVTPQEFRRELT